MAQTFDPAAMMEQGFNMGVSVAVARANYAAQQHDQALRDRQFLQLQDNDSVNAEVMRGQLQLQRDELALRSKEVMAKLSQEPSTYERTMRKIAGGISATRAVGRAIVGTSPEDVSSEQGLATLKSTGAGTKAVETRTVAEQQEIDQKTALFPLIKAQYTLANAGKEMDNKAAEQDYEQRMILFPTQVALLSKQLGIAEADLKAKLMTNTMLFMDVTNKPELDQLTIDKVKTELGIMGAQKEAIASKTERENLLLPGGMKIQEAQAKKLGETEPEKSIFSPEVFYCRC